MTAWLCACEVRPLEPLPAGTVGPVLHVATLAVPITSLTSSLDGNRVLLQWTGTDGATTVMESRNRGRRFHVAADQTGVPHEAAAAWTVADSADRLLVRVRSLAGREAVLPLPRPTDDAVLAWVGPDDDGLALMLWRTASGRHLLMTRQAMNPLEAHIGMGFDAPITVAVDAVPGAPATVVPLHGGALVAWIVADGPARRVVTREFAFEALCAPSPAGVTRPPLVGAPGLPVLPPIVLH